MMKTRSSLGLILLTLIVYASKINIVVAKLCESEDGRSSKECDDDENCCESDDGEVECCAGLGIAGIVVMAFFFFILFICCLCCCLIWHHKKKRQNSQMDCLCSQCDDSSQTIISRTVVVQSTETLPEQRSAGVVYRTRRVLVPEPSNSRNVTLIRMNNVNKPSSSSHGNSNDHTNTLPTNNHCTNTNGDAPPPYCSDDAPPPYAEIDL